MSCRRLDALIRGLPLDSALARSLDTSGRLASGWTTQTELAALTVEFLDRHTRTYMSGQGVKGHDLPKPIHIPRPGTKPTVTAPPGAVRGFFAQRGVPVIQRRKRGKPT